MTQELAQRTIQTPVGPLVIGATQHGVSSVEFGKGLVRKSNQLPVSAGAKKHLKQAEIALRAYFNGDARALLSVNLDVQKGTPFQRAVWNCLKKIPAGETRSYGEVAKKIGRPKAVRAVGAACRANPVCVVVPCHRVIGKNGSLTGFAGGMNRKRALLQHESSE